MSLFDIIKYSSTDLDSEEELSNLPEDLRRLYAAEVHSEVYLAFGHRHAVFEHYSINTMANWETISGKPKRVTFMRALRKYSNDDI
jgi:hypothetical protein